MKAIGIVLGNDKNEMFWRSVHEALKQKGIRLTRVTTTNSVESIGQTLRRRSPQVLIIDAPSSGPTIRYRSYLDTYPDLTIIGIDSESTDLTMFARNVHLKELADLVSGMSVRARDQEDAVDRLYLLDPTQLRGWSLTDTPSEHPKPHSRFQKTGQDREAHREPARTEEAKHEPAKAKIDEEPAECSTPEPEVVVAPPKETPLPAQQLPPATPKKRPKDELERERRWVRLVLATRLARESDRGSDAEGRRPWQISLAEARALLGDKLSNASVDELVRMRRDLESDVLEGTTRFASVCEAFDLVRRDRRILLAAVAPEIDGTIARIFSYLNDDASRRRPTPAMLADLLGGTGYGISRVLSSLTDRSALLEDGLIEIEEDGGRPLGDAELSPAREIVEYLISPEAEPPRYARFLSVTLGSADVAGEGPHDEDFHFDGPITQLVGAATPDRFAIECMESGRSLVTCDLSLADPDSAPSVGTRCSSAVRVTRLHGAALMILGRDGIPESERRMLDRTVIPDVSHRVDQLAIHGASPWPIESHRGVDIVEYPSLGLEKRAELWSSRAKALGVRVRSEDVLWMARTVRFREPEIDAVLRLCGDACPTRSDLQEAIRRVTRGSIPETVRRVDTTYEWGDIVLPQPTLEDLRGIGCHVRHSDHVLDTWGYRKRMPYGHGVTALFAGPSGCGKTMAAQIIARDLGIELLQVDLAKTVSKFIGDTEKNLEDIFCAAEDACAAILFDEAESLFTKRTEVRDAHDRYANVEVAYLLQRMEQFSGLAILTTNLRHNLDPAFLRRLRFVVEFKAPTAREREAIWNRVFPIDAPLAKDVKFTRLAQRLALTGGHIQQIAVRAAFAAAEEGGPIHMRHVIAATRVELRKLGMESAEKKLEVAAA